MRETPMSPVDLTKLREALARLGPDDPDVPPIVERAARALLGGDTLEWCAVHNAESIQNHSGPSDECWRVVWVPGDGPEPESVGPEYKLCRMVRGRFVPVEEER